MAFGPLLTDAQWAKILPHLPALPRRKDGRGRPWANDRACFEGILWVLRTGAHWKALPTEYPSPATCWRRLRRWEDDGTWLKLWRAFLAELDGRHRLHWSEAFIDGSFAPAKNGGVPSARPSGGKARSGWWWQTARVFLWEAPWPRPRLAKSRSSTRRSRRLPSPARGRGGPARSPTA